MDRLKGRAKDIVGRPPVLSAGEEEVLVQMMKVG